MPKTAHRIRRVRPPEILVIGFAAMIVVGALLLAMPAASANEPLPLVDAFFTATSAVCVTGLSVFDPGSVLTRYGQIVLLVLIQCGGLGFMTLTSAIYRMLGKRFSLQGRVVLRESLNEEHLGKNLGRMTIRIVGITAVCEGTGAILLMLRFIPMFGVERGIYYSIFHAISSFCNAGFDVFGLSSNMIPFFSDPLINFVTMALITIGGFGFFVVMELMERLAGVKRRPSISLQTRVVVLWSGVLVAIGFGLVALAEWDNPGTLGAPEYTDGERIMGALFQSVTTRTAGFMTVSQGELRPISQMMTILLMFIGASPAGTGGGLKTTTAAALFAFVWATLRGRKDIVIRRRRIAMDVVHRAVVMFTIGILAVAIVSSLISVLEPTMELSDVVFETASAFGTVGLSVGITGSLSAPSLVLLMITMFGGRVGFFTLTVVLANRFSDKDANVRYPQERLIIG